MLVSSLLSQGLKFSTCIQSLSPFYLLINKLWVEHSGKWVLTSAWKVPRITPRWCFVSISGAYHIHHLCQMHFESCAISHDYQSKRYENDYIARLDTWKKQYIMLHRFSIYSDIVPLHWYEYLILISGSNLISFRDSLCMNGNCISWTTALLNCPLKFHVFQIIKLD